MSSGIRVLAINPGSTSTKVGAFIDDRLDWEAVIRHTDDELGKYEAVLQQVRFRLKAIESCLSAHSAPEEQWNAVVARGGLLRPIKGGTYLVNDAMLEELRAAERGEHASNLGAFLAAAFSKRCDCQALVVDPVSVDELEDVARLSGLAGLDRECLSHALNTKAIARRYAYEHQRAYEQLRLIVAHLGSGTSVSAHRDGRMIDVNNSREEGPFSTERAGSVPVLGLVRRAIAEHWSVAEAERRLFREGGVYSYLGTRDIEQVLDAADSGDTTARIVIDAMLHQDAKEIGAMAAVLGGDVDAILLTGGLTHSTRITEALSNRIKWIAPVHVYPGEDELRALAAGAFRVLRGAESALAYSRVPRTPATAALLPIPRQH
jgi:butyrate kinase